MAEFITTQGTLSEIEKIIRSAKNRLVLISPYIQLSDNFLQRLQDADKQNIEITLVYEKGKLKPEERGKLEKLSHLSLYHFEELHAKCFFNEECMVITSMNFYDSSEKNREMGVVLRKSNEEKVFHDAVKEAQSIIIHSTKDIPKHEEGSNLPLKATHLGFCLRCGSKIAYDLDRPYCRKCFSVWADYEDPDCEESYCHTCGSPWSTTMLKPQCNSCYYSRR